MRKFQLIIFIILISLSACNRKETDIISAIKENALKHQSIHFKVDQKYYYDNGIDTVETPFEVWAFRDTTDTIRNGYVWVDNNYRPYHLMYNNNEMHLAIPPKNTTILYKNYNHPLISDIDWIDMFLIPEKLSEITSKFFSKTYIKDTIYDKIDCKSILITYINKDEHEVNQLYFIDKNKLVPMYAQKIIKTNDYTYFEELIFSNYEFDVITIDELKNKKDRTLAENPVKNRQNDEISRLEKMLHIGDDAPKFTGKYYQNEDIFNLQDHIGTNVFIVDFWYTHCPPCVKAMPALNELYDMYKDKGFKIFGLNSVDNQPNGIDYLNKFIRKRNINYDVILIKPEVDLMYKVSGYPTMYLVDRNGKIAFVELGFNEEKFAELKSKVEELINQ